MLPSYDLPAEILTQLGKIKWRYLVCRQEAILMSSFTDTGYLYSEETLQIPWKATNILRLGDGNLFLSAEQFQELYQFFRDCDLQQLEEFKEKLVKVVNSYEAIAQDIEKKDWQNASIAEVRKTFTEFVMAAIKAHCFLTPLPIADKALTDDLKNQLGCTEELLRDLIYPTQTSLHTQEELDFFHLVSLRNEPNFSAKLQRHLQKYAWIGARWYQLHHAWKEDDLLERINAFLQANKDAENEAEAIMEAEKSQRQISQEKLNSITLPFLRKKIELARDFAYLRTWRTDVIYRAGYRARRLLYRIVSSVNIPEEFVSTLSYQEMEYCLEQGKAPVELKVLQERRNSCTKITFDNRYWILTGKKWVKLLAPPEKMTREIKGYIACAGTALGRAKIVLTVDDLSKVSAGDILVATMTFPNFIPAMEKAAAFVTDEGGILCHAAIVSREMRKPCITGTGNATKLLQDGDVVEVNGYTGVVRKIG